MARDPQTMKQKLFFVIFSDGFKKPVLAITAQEAQAAACAELNRPLSDVAKTLLEECYYPYNEDAFDI